MITKGIKTLPYILDIHPVSGKCNLNCVWCVGRHGRTKLETLENKMNVENVKCMLNSLFYNTEYNLLPKEFHICGADSEPLLNKDVVKTLIKYLKDKNRIVELITNGILLDNPVLCKEILRIDKLSISLDVTNDEDFFKYKVNMKNGMKDGFTRVLSNIKNIYELKRKYKSKLSIYVTFVAIKETFDYDEWKKCMIKLRDIGVNHVQVRTDINDQFNIINLVKCQINEIAKELNADNVKYDNDYNFDIMFHTPLDADIEAEFKHCYGLLLWPTIAADLKLYKCAHTAISKYNSSISLDKISSFDELYELINETNVLSCAVDEIGCDRICPPIIKRFNGSDINYIY